MFSLDNLVIGGDTTVIIAEAGVNHLNRKDYAENLISTASAAGANIVKFQTYSASSLVTKRAPRFWQWDGEAVSDGTQFDSYSRLESHDPEFTLFLANTCTKFGVTFMSTPFDNEAVDLLDRIGCGAFKVASCDITNLPLLRHIASKKKPIFLSTGASTIYEIKVAVNIIRQIYQECPLVIMHCVLTYPTRPSDANLGALIELKREFPGAVLGLSDHTIGPLIPAASVLLGVKVIEKHYTFDKSLPESADHWLSVDQLELTQLVRDVRLLEKTISLGYKSISPSESMARAYARRSVVAKLRINKGEKFGIDNLTCKRPGTGISPWYFDQIIGLTAARDIEYDQLITDSDIFEDADFKKITPATLKYES
jgi:N,N'-diacetyllegionaminate synthase